VGTVATTVNANPLIWPSTTLIDRSPLTGHLWAVVKASAADTYEFRRSTNGGTSWSTVFSVVRGNVQEVGSILVPSDGMIYWCFRTAEGGQDRIYFQRFYLGPPLQVGPQILVASAGNEGVAGATYQGLDMQSAVRGDGVRYVVVAMGTTVGATHGVVLVGATISTRGVHAASTAMLTGTRWWFATGAGRITPSLEIEHVGDSKTGAPAHLWVTWGRTDVYIAKLAYSNGAWQGPTSPVRINPVTLAAQDSIAGRWDGQRLLVATPDPSATDRVQILERNRANSRTTQRQTPAHPAGNVRNCSLSYDAKTGNIRVYAVGTSSAVLHFVDYNRAAGTWTAWAQVTATAILGTAANNYSVRRSTAGNARYDVLTAHAGSPNTIVSTHQVVAYPPDTPMWDTPAIGVDNGAAANVTEPLNLQWTFTDPDPFDMQSAWALSRQVGSGAVQYLRASDNTWQPAEVKNNGMSIARPLPAGWGLTSDAPHSYKVKVWDSTDNGSAYSNAMVVVPSGKVNPVITSPTASQVITQDRVTVTWTVAEQTAYRVRLKIFSETPYDSGWRAGGDTSHTPDLALGNGFGYTAVVQTRNLEGLASDEVEVSFTVTFNEPAEASLTATPLPEAGVIRVAITNPAPAGSQPAVASQDVYRRPVTSPILLRHDFESADLSGWGTPLAGTAVRSNARAKSGSWSYQLTADGTDIVSHVETVLIPCTVGTTYFADMWIANSAANRGTFAQIRWYNAGGAQIISSNGLEERPPAVNVFDYRWVAAMAPTGATHMKVCAVVAFPAAGEIIWVDDVRLRVNDSSNGVRVAAGLPANATFDDWRVVSGVEYEYRVQTRSVIGTTVGGVWTP
jgi:hypothetical protein